MLKIIYWSVVSVVGGVAEHCNIVLILLVSQSLIPASSALLAQHTESHSIMTT